MLANTAMVPADTTICHGLQADVQSNLYEISSIQDVPAKEMIFMEGDWNEYVYEVMEGVVLLSKLTVDGRRQVTGFIYPGQIFGFSINEQNGYTAESITKARICRYPRSRLNRSMTLYPALGRRFLDWASGELVAAQNQMLLLGRKTAVERVASFFLSLSERNDEHGEDPTRLFVPMTRCDIADYLGLTMETVSRTIGRLKKSGVIQLSKQNYIEVCDLDRLYEYTEDETGSW